MTENIHFHSGNLRLEGIWRPTEGAPGVVVAHPHTLYGGDMHNPVVTTIADGFASAGYSTLRFNFRGSGASQGAFDDGPGEQADLRAAVEWVGRRTRGNPMVAGYSFGGWVAAGAAATGGLAADRLYLISPPVAFLPFDADAAPPRLGAVVAGSRDDFGPLDRIKSLLTQWRSTAPLAVIDGCDHFYSGHLAELADALRPHIPAAETGSQPAQ